MEKIAIIQCNCKHEFQDAKYGVGKRVGNFAVKKSSPNNNAYRCTVCNNIVVLNDSGKALEEKKK